MADAPATIGQLMLVPDAGHSLHERSSVPSPAAE